MTATLSPTLAHTPRTHTPRSHTARTHTALSRTAQVVDVRDARRANAESDVNYAARRLVAVAGLVAAVVLVAFGSLVAVGPLLAGGGAPASASVGIGAAARTHVAEPGDTLWSIAERYRGDVEQGRFVDALIDANGGTAIQVGQAIRLP